MVAVFCFSKLIPYLPPCAVNIVNSLLQTVNFIFNFISKFCLGPYHFLHQLLMMPKYVIVATAVPSYFKRCRQPLVSLLYNSLHLTCARLV